MIKTCKALIVVGAILLFGCGRSGPKPEMTDKRIETHIDKTATITKTEIYNLLKKATIATNRGNKAVIAQFVTPEAPPPERAQTARKLAQALYGAAKLDVAAPKKKDVCWTARVTVTTVKRKTRSAEMDFARIKGKLCVVAVRNQ